MTPIEYQTDAWKDGSFERTGEESDSAELQAVTQPPRAGHFWNVFNIMNPC